MGDYDFDELMAETNIGDFSAFMLSEEEVEAAKKERKEQIERNVKELKALMEKAEAANAEGKGLSNEDIRKIKRLSADKMVLIAAMDDKYTIDELVDMENGDYVPPESEQPKELSLEEQKKLIEETLIEKSIITPPPAPAPTSTSNIAYYEWVDGEPNKFVITSKDWWNAEKVLDDSKSPLNKPIFDALEEIGCVESAESIYETNLSKSELISKMKEKGFNLRKNQAFSDFCKKVL